MTTKTANRRPKKLHLDRRVSQIMATEQPISDDQPIHNDDLLTTSQLALWLGVTVVWLESCRRNGWGPPYLQVTPHLIRYRRDEVRAWLKQREKLSLEGRTI
jgi:hypothetical protein